MAARSETGRSRSPALEDRSNPEPAVRRQLCGSRSHSVSDEGPWDHYAPWVGYTAFIVPRSMSVPKLMTKSRAIPKCHDILFSLVLSADKFELPDGRVKSINGVALQVSRHIVLRDQKANPVSIRGCPQHPDPLREGRSARRQRRPAPHLRPRLQRLADAQIAWSKKS